MKTARFPGWSLMSAGGDQRGACEARLDANGLSQCKSHCATFPSE